MAAAMVLEQVATQPQRRESPAVAALRDHGSVCKKCREAARAGLPIRSLCRYGYVLARCAQRARARRAS
jgi:hypothetical protein